MTPPHDNPQPSLRDRTLAANLLHDWRTGDGIESGAAKVVPEDCLINTRRLAKQQTHRTARAASRRPKP